VDRFNIHTLADWGRKAEEAQYLTEVSIHAGFVRVRAVWKGKYFDHCIPHVELAAAGIDVVPFAIDRVNSVMRERQRKEGGRD
jgi:hypothetical protein